MEMSNEQKRNLALVGQYGIGVADMLHDNEPIKDTSVAIEEDMAKE
jgi:hypothetical protein